MNSAVDITIPSQGKGLVDTQISVAVPAGMYGHIAPQSGLSGHSCDHDSPLDKADADFFKASKFMIDTGVGVINADYRGVVGPVEGRRKQRKNGMKGMIVVVERRRSPFVSHICMYMS